MVAATVSAPGWRCCGFESETGQRIFWRDLHGRNRPLDIRFCSFCSAYRAPLGKEAGELYFEEVRKLASASVVQQDWTRELSSEIAEREAMTRNPSPSDAEHAEHMGYVMPRVMRTDAHYRLNTLSFQRATLDGKLAYPVMIMPAMEANGPWTVRSDAQNRTLRTIVRMDPNSGVEIGREEFHQRHLLDRIVGVSIAAHEGSFLASRNQFWGYRLRWGL